MSTRSERYPVLYIIFTLLNAIRRGVERRNIWREFRRQKSALQPRLAFWIAILQQLLQVVFAFEPVFRERLARTGQDGEQALEPKLRGWSPQPALHLAVGRDPDGTTAKLCHLREGSSRD